MFHKYCICFHLLQIGSNRKIHLYYENNKRNISHTSTKKTYSSSIMENCFTNIVYIFICYRLGVIGRSICIMRIIRGNLSHISTKKTYSSSITENCFTNIVYVFICYRLGVNGKSICIMRIIRGIYLIPQQRKHIAVASWRIVSQILYMFSSVTDWE